MNTIAICLMVGLWVITGYLLLEQQNETEELRARLDYLAQFVDDGKEGKP